MSKESLQTQLEGFSKDLETHRDDDKKIASILVKRAEVYKAMGRMELAVADAKTAVQKDPANEETKKFIQQLYSATESVEPEKQSSKPLETSQDPRVDRFRSYLDQLSTAKNVKAFVSSPDFIQVLTSCGNPEDASQVRTVAFMLLTKLFNPSPDISDYPTNFIIEQCGQCFSHCVGSGKTNDKLLAYRTLSAIFQTSMTAGAAILSQQGVVEEMVDVVEFETLDVQIAVAEVLAIASTDKSCQKAIVQYASQWLAKLAGSKTTDDRLRAVAGTTLTKLRASGSDATSAGKTDTKDSATILQEAMQRMNLKDADLVTALKQVVKNPPDDATIILNAVEGLAYSSLQSEVKEALVSDSQFMQALGSLAVHDNENNPLLFGIGTIFANITMYPPVLDEQQKQVQKLRDLANAKQSKTAVPKDDPLETNKAVEVRVKTTIDSGVAIALIALSKNTSANIRWVASQTYLNLVTPQACRGKLLQQGIVKPLLSLAAGKSESHTEDKHTIIAAQALAKLAITSDPRLAFGAQQSLSLVKPFLRLCKDEKQLRQFEGLMALTNLASVSDDVRAKIVDEDGMSIFENLQLSNHEMIQRAATEMVCNMTFCEAVFENYSDPKSQNKIRLLLIFSDHEDMATRRAASGALAILSNSKSVCEMISKVDRGYERVARLIEKAENVEIQHRGIEIIRCMVQELDKDAANAFVKQNVPSQLVDIVKHCNVNPVRSAAMDVLKMFVAKGVQINI
ncbi:armadillo-type protein [Radiomyces spectabilis]|uniref:armadillo-type protein n=1 Tax=Radiomyces spectabilis TaxID=64574 RepID=UPI00221EFFA0|nr:armadillo-type protein [Radiomyces spectabilis]KAI8379756.1 armadillo-type protein [Radiomyces spectabilis]